MDIGIGSVLREGFHPVYLFEDGLYAAQCKALVLLLLSFPCHSQMIRNQYIRTFREERHV
jgi:hypothetical protein